MIYTVISNRESCEDSYMGCLMARTDSEFQIYTTDDKLKATHKTTEFLVSSMKNTNKNLNSDYNAYAGADIYVLVNGMGVGGGHMYIETELTEDVSDSYEDLYNESREILTLADAKAKLIISELEQEILAKQKQRQAAAQETQRKREQAEYERLKAKFGE